MEVQSGLILRPYSELVRQAAPPTLSFDFRGILPGQGFRHYPGSFPFGFAFPLGHLDREVPEQTVRLFPVLED